MLAATLKSDTTRTFGERTLGAFAVGLATFIIVLARVLFSKNIPAVHDALNPMAMDFRSWLGIYLFKQFAIVLVWDNVRLMNCLVRSF